MRTLEEIERCAPGVGSVVCVSFDWRDPNNPREWRPEWRAVLDDIRRKQGQAQNAEVAAQNQAALTCLTNRQWVKPDTTAVVVAWVHKCLEHHMPKRDQFHPWVCSTIQESTHKVFRQYRLWEDPKYANKDRKALEAFNVRRDQETHY